LIGDQLGRAWPLVTLPIGVWMASRLTARFAPEVAGHGVPQIIASIAVRGGHVRARVAGLKTVATALTIGSGGSAGREGSIAQIGSSIGSWVARVSRLGENDVRVLVAAGAGAGISATFNAPIAGMFFAMEVILREFSLRHVHTVVVASVAGAVVSRTLVGEGLTFQVESYALQDARQLLLYGILGLVTVAIAWLFLTALDWFEIRPGRLPSWARPLLLGLVVATLGVIRPEILSSGQNFVNEVLRNEIESAWWLLGILAVMKAVATAATLGGKGSGGIFMPSLFIGATTGSAFARLMEPLWSWSTIQPGAYALIGMAATFSAVARAPLTSILIVFEITGDYGLVLPLMIATAISTILAGRVRPESAYQAPLTRMGIHPAHGGVTDLLDTISVGDVVRRETITVEPDVSLGEVQGLLQRNRLHGVPVVSDGRLVGLVAESDIVRAGGPSDQVHAVDAMTPNPATVIPETPVSEALERMAALGVGRLPVVDAEDATHLVGMFRREDVITAYHRALGASARRGALPDRLRARTQAGARFFEIEIPTGSAADGRPISEFPWPEGCLLVSINRGSELLIPTGSSVLHAGDAITAFGGDGPRDRLAERLAVGPELQQPE
jgi:CIC family chloride channel protein